MRTEIENASNNPSSRWTWNKSDFSARCQCFITSTPRVCVCVCYLLALLSKVDVLKNNTNFVKLSGAIGSLVSKEIEKKIQTFGNSTWSTPKILSAQWNVKKSAISFVLHSISCRYHRNPSRIAAVSYLFRALCTNIASKLFLTEKKSDLTIDCSVCNLI